MRSPRLISGSVWPVGMGGGIKPGVATQTKVVGSKVVWDGEGGSYKTNLLYRI